MSVADYRLPEVTCLQVFAFTPFNGCTSPGAGLTCALRLRVFWGCGREQKAKT